MSTFVCKITNWSYGYFIMTPIMGVLKDVLSGVDIGKNRQTVAIKNS